MATRVISSRPGRVTAKRLTIGRRGLTDHMKVSAQQKCQSTKHEDGISLVSRTTIIDQQKFPLVHKGTFKSIHIKEFPTIYIFTSQLLMFFSFQINKMK